MGMAGTGEGAFVVTFGRAGEDNKKFKLGDADVTLQGFAGADYDLQVAHSHNNVLYTEYIETCKCYTGYVFQIPQPLAALSAEKLSTVPGQGCFVWSLGQHSAKLKTMGGGPANMLFHFILACLFSWPAANAACCFEDAPGP